MSGTVSPLQQLFVVGTIIPIAETQRDCAVASGHTAQMTWHQDWKLRRRGSRALCHLAMPSCEGVGRALDWESRPLPTLQAVASERSGHILFPGRLVNVVPGGASAQLTGSPLFCCLSMSFCASVSPSPFTRDNNSYHCCWELYMKLAAHCMILCTVGCPPLSWELCSSCRRRK